MSDIVKLSQTELDRAATVQGCIAGLIPNGEAAELLGVSVRQLKRLKQRFKSDGAKSLASQKRGRPSNNQLPNETKAQAQTLLYTRYGDFGPTLAHEKLFEVHHVLLSRETMRQLMIQEKLWKPHRGHRPAVHQLRVRRARRDELIQIHGCPFDWFEGRAPSCTFLVLIDDATGDWLEPPSPRLRPPIIVTSKLRSAT